MKTVAGDGGLHRYRQEPYLADGKLAWRNATKVSRDPAIVAPVAKPFSPDGGLKVLAGNLGRAVIKTSAVKPEHRVVQAPAIVFESQEQVMAAFDRGELKRDLVAVVRYQGPRANGMSAAAAMLVAVLQAHERIEVVAARDCYSETRELMQSFGARLHIVAPGRGSDGAQGSCPRILWQIGRAHV